MARKSYSGGPARRGPGKKSARARLARRGAARAENLDCPDEPGHQSDVGPAHGPEWDEPTNPEAGPAHRFLGPAPPGPGTKTGPDRIIAAGPARAKIFACPDGPENPGWAEMGRAGRPPTSGPARPTGRWGGAGPCGPARLTLPWAGGLAGHMGRPVPLCHDSYNKNTEYQ